MSCEAYGNIKDVMKKFQVIVGDMSLPSKQGLSLNSLSVEYMARTITLYISYYH